MKRRTLAALLVALGCALTGCLNPAAADEMFAEPGPVVSAVEKLGAPVFASHGAPIRAIQLDGVNAATAREWRAKRAGRLKMGQPLQIGFARDVPAGQAPLRLDQWPWESLPGGGLAAKFSVTSEGAEALRAAIVLTVVDPISARREVVWTEDVEQQQTNGVTLRFSGSGGGDAVQTMDGAGPADGMLVWSPIVNGDTLTVEVALAPGVAPAQVLLSVPQVSHIDIHPLASAKTVAAKIGESADCEWDVICYPNPSQAFLNTFKSVVLLAYTESDGNSYTCSGTLLNNDNSPKRWLVYTARHCFNNQTAANSVQSYWFYDASSCGGSTLSGSARTTTGGAYLRWSDYASDIALLELKKAVPSGVIYAGWNTNSLVSASPSTYTTIMGIHHPRGDVKKYSIGSTQGATAYVDNGNTGPLTTVTWRAGVTEPGSSGSGLFTLNETGILQLRGGLWGGVSVCGVSGPDYYSRLQDGYSSLKPYLRP